MKKAICTVLTIVLVLSLFVPASFASEASYESVVYEVERTNAEIENFIEQAFKDVEEILKSDKSEIKLEKEINKVIEKLVDDTNKLARKMIESAAKVGIEVICEYVEVEIGNQKILIDPLRIVGF